MTLIESIALIAGLLVVGGAALWYLLITTEGVYLGRRVVIWLYDVYARRYDRIKNFDAEWEAIMLARPILTVLHEVASPLILDVATGTGRLPLTLINEPDFRGHIVGLDYSRLMLKVAAEKLAALEPEARWQVDLVCQPAQALPFADETFDAVTCLEALEFMPDPNAVITELVRVARPGALILITNRRGLGARLMPGKTQSGEQLAVRLRDRYNLEEVTRSVWQVDYELVWAYKPGLLEPALDQADAPVESLLRCPFCAKHTLLRENRGNLHCNSCEAHLSVASDGIIEYNNARRSDSGMR
jgi:ubiquinone/menaquinone biosynthesis C-methylase UbiE